MNRRPAAVHRVFHLANEAQTDRFGAAIAPILQPGVVIGLIGPLGAGKTRLARAVAVALEVPADHISSPTYVLIHEYLGRLPVYHFDAYRLPDLEAFEALGAAEYLEGQGVCLIEWADRVLDALPDHAWILTLEPVGPDERRVVVDAPPHVASRLAAQWPDIT